MRIALDCSSACRPQDTGVAVYVRRLVQALGAVDREDDFVLLHRLSRWRQRAHFVRPPGANFRTKLFCEPLHPLLARRTDVFHGLDARLPGRWFKARLVVTVHDVFSVLQSGEFAPEEFRELKARRYQDLAARADRIIVVSAAAQRDVLATLHPDPAKLRVIHEAAGPEFRPRGEEEARAVRARHGLDRPYLLYVGSLNRRKNIPAMLRGFLRARERAKSDALFALAGRTGFGGEDIRAALAPHTGPGGCVRLLGHVPDADLAPLYSGAWGLLFVTRYEGFGLPVVEAFGCGCPVLGGTAGSVAEIAGDAALLAGPEDEGEIAAQVERLLTDEALRADLRTRGLARARDFSWEKTARATLGVYRELL